ncbi:sensor histidine kinase [Nonomuraea endophytica]|uniref:histidine kinase n=1 Tax=Nonomuraea endophytica TaxID=714136 RepID=A0A7W7ZWN5_9ACTN|nr:histidine kinase [Nonomuraea endophytica]MBB5074706.1 signal transduction histidine kinase [Nonomuraea endophytica]
MSATARLRPTARFLAGDLFWIVPLGVVSWLLANLWPPYQPWADLGMTVALLAPMPWRHLYPVGVFTLVSFLALLQILNGWPPLLADLSVCVALATLAVSRHLVVSLPALIITCTGQVFWAVLYPAATMPFPWVANQLLFIVLVWFAGRYVLAKRMVMQGIRERLMLAERAREGEAREAVDRERLRIARDLHDSVAHNVTVMITQAEGARLGLDADPAGARTALAQIAECGRAALHDMRELVSALRAGSCPRPWREVIDDLVQKMRRSGVPDIAVRVEGEPDTAPDEVLLAAQQVVGEALTNVLKHAGRGVAVSVFAAFTATGAYVRVEDDGGGPLAAVSLPAGGNGVVGLRERVCALGGEFSAGARRGGGFVVEARLPYPIRLSYAAKGRLPYAKESGDAP